jgi:hypothetical protein
MRITGRSAVVLLVFCACRAASPTTPFDRALKDELERSPIASRWLTAAQREHPGAATFKLTSDLVADGMNRLDDEHFVTFARLHASLLDRLRNSESCIAYVRGAAPSDYERDVPLLPESDQRSFAALIVDSMNAALAMRPRVDADRDALSAGFDAVMASLPPAELNKFRWASNSKTDAPLLDQCWARRTLYGRALGLPTALRGKFLRALVSPRASTH